MNVVVGATTRRGIYKSSRTPILMIEVVRKEFEIGIEAVLGELK